MVDAFTIAEDMEVVGSDGGYVGTVDALQGADIRLNRKDSETGGVHRLIPLDWVETVEVADRRVRLRRTRDEPNASGARSDPRARPEKRSGI